MSVTYHGQAKPSAAVNKASDPDMLDSNAYHRLNQAARTLPAVSTRFSMDPRNPPPAQPRLDRLANEPQRDLELTRQIGILEEWRVLLFAQELKAVGGPNADKVRALLLRPCSPL